LYRGAGGIRLRLSEQTRLEVSFEGVMYKNQRDNATNPTKNMKKEQERCKHVLPECHLHAYIQHIIYFVAEFTTSSL